MKTRIISGCVMAPMFVFLILGGWWLFGLCLILSCMAMWEFWKGFAALNLKPNVFFGYGFYALYALIIAICFEIGNVYELYNELFAIWLFLLISSSVVLAVFTKGNDIYKGPLAALGVLYIGFFLSHVVLVERTGPTSRFVWIIFLSAFGSDIAAYFTGLYFGTKHIFTVVSPKKTLEGCIGGVIGSIILCTLFGIFFCKGYVLHCMILGMFSSVFSQLGDLTASAFKRKMGIKDYSNLIPGHGGIMDRFDSVIFSAPLVFYYIKVFVK